MKVLFNLMKVSTGHPFSAVLPGTRAKIFVPLIIVWAMAWVGVYLADQPLQTAAAPHGLTSLALSGQALTARWIIQTWTNNNRAIPLAHFSIGLSFLWLAAGSTALSLACAWTAQQVPYRRWASIGYALAWGQWIGAVLGGAANIALLFMLSGSVEAPWPVLAWLCAYLQVSLFAMGAVWGAAGIPARQYVSLFPARFHYVPR